MVKVKSAVLKEFSKPFAIETLEKGDVKEGWRRVRVKATGICGRDIVVWKGGFKNLKPPLILGHEVFGELDDKPVGIYPGFTVGEDKKPFILGEDLPGGYAEYVDAPYGNIVELPTRDYEKYAAAVCGVATMIHVARISGIGCCDRVLVTGAGGGVGIHGVQYLSMLGANVYGYTRRPEAARVLRGLGVNVVDSLDFYKKIGRMDYVVEIAGGPTINRSMRSLRFEGTLVLVGNVTGEPLVIDRPALFIMRQLRVIGSAAYSIDEYRYAIKLVGDGLIRAFYKRYSLDDVNRAYSDIMEGRIIGRGVLVP
ncbi:MAG: zinc-binding dehydrogenase [Desulfurococcales archaeon]|nr:zinc-binding dehydrogenase [Desulfurococcales archaeon]